MGPGLASLERVRLCNLLWLWERGTWSLLGPSFPRERPLSPRVVLVPSEDPDGGFGFTVGVNAERSREWLRARSCEGRRDWVGFPAPPLSIACFPSLRLTSSITSSPERREAPPREYRPPPPPFDEAVEESLSPDRRLVNDNFVSLVLGL